MLLPAALLSIASISPGPGLQELAESDCAAITQDAAGKRAIVDLPDLKVIEATRSHAWARYPLPDRTVALRCFRDSIVPVRNDFRVLQRGLSLYIAVLPNGAQEPRIGVLELHDGKAGYRLGQGEISPDERHRILAVLELIRAELEQPAPLRRKSDGP